jgi:hypothetical protein
MFLLRRKLHVDFAAVKAEQESDTARQGSRADMNEIHYPCSDTRRPDTSAALHQAFQMPFVGCTAVLIHAVSCIVLEYSCMESGLVQ